MKVEMKVDRKVDMKVDMRFIIVFGYSSWSNHYETNHIKSIYKINDLNVAFGRRHPGHFKGKNLNVAFGRRHRYFC